ncbi:hypothetical protein E2320_012161, partial [Naja naja]
EDIITGQYLHAPVFGPEISSTKSWHIAMLRTLQLLMAAYRMFLSIFRDMSPENFQTAMKYLFGRTQKYLELGNILINLHGIRKKLFESPGGNRTLVLITLEKCFVLLNSAECGHLKPDPSSLFSHVSPSPQRGKLPSRSSERGVESVNNSTSWVSAENLWILGRYMVHLPLEEIRKINPYEMWLFVSYDNATKQLDMVYDITPDLAQAFLERIDASGFDMRNISTLYRQALFPPRLHFEELSNTVHSAISMLNQVSRWARSQTIILSGKYLLYEKALSFHNVSQMGALAPGIDTLSFYNMNPNELSQAVQNPDLLTTHIGAPRSAWCLFTEVSLFDLWKAGSFNASLVKNKELRPSQIRKSASFAVPFQVKYDHILICLFYFQQKINCLAWKFWTISEASVPPYLLAVLPSPRNWTAETIKDHGAFMLLLPKDDLITLLEKFPDFISETALKTSRRLSARKQLLLAQFESLYASRIPTQPSNSTPDCEDVMAPSSDEIIKLSEANMFWSIQELNCMESRTFAQTVEILGQRYHIVSLGCIVTSLNEKEIARLDLSLVDTVSALTQQTAWNPSQARSILQGFLDDSGQELASLKSFDLVALDASLCTLNSTEVASIHATEFSAVLARMGSLPCSFSTLQEFKKKVESVFGSPMKWSPAILQEMGTIAAGFNEKELRALDHELMAYFQPAAIASIPSEIFKRQHLSEEQLQSLRLALDGGRRSIREVSLNE